MRNNTSPIEVALLYSPSPEDIVRRLGNGVPYKFIYDVLQNVTAIAVPWHRVKLKELSEHLSSYVYIAPDRRSTLIVDGEAIDLGILTHSPKDLLKHSDNSLYDLTLKEYFCFEQ